MMTQDQAIAKAKKLLETSKLYGPEEAANASAQAAKLIEQYQISEAALQSYDESEKEEISIFNLDPNGKLDSKNKVFWRMRIAGGCAIVCNCRAFWDDRNIIQLLGREKDVKTARYLYDMICHQISKAADKSWYDKQFNFNIDDLDELEDLDNANDFIDNINSRDDREDQKSYIHAFKLGCADGVREKLVEQHNHMHRELKNKKLSDNNSAQALMVIDRRLERVKNIFDKIGLTTVAVPQARDVNAYISGYKHRDRINTSTGAAVGAIGEGSKRLKDRSIP